MAKTVIAKVKLQIPAGKANPAPPVGPALGQHGVNIMEFCKAFNARTSKMQEGLIIPALVTIYSDRRFSFVTKTPPASVLIKMALKLKKGSSDQKRNKVAKITKTQLAEIAKQKLPDLSAYDIDNAVKIIEGTAKSMGIEVI